MKLDNFSWDLPKSYVALSVEMVTFYGKIFSRP